MIGFVRALIEELILLPQGDETVPEERRVYLDPESRPLDVMAQEADVRAVTSVPVAWEIGGGLEVRHRISVAVDVQHGDPAEAVRRRDAIALDLCLRIVDETPAILAATDEVTGQYPTRVEWSVDYTPLATSDTNESATIAVDVTTQIDR